MNTNDHYPVAQEQIAPASHLEKVITRTVGAGLALALAVGGTVVAKNAYEDFQNPDYEISIIDTPANKWYTHRILNSSLRRAKPI